MFADLLESESGRCFAICFTHVSKGEQFFRNMVNNGAPAIGSIFVIEEPDQVTNFLGSNDSVPIVESWNRIVPMSLSVSRCLNNVQLTRGDPGRTNYFSEKGLNGLKFFGAAIKSASCNGYFCDRQVPYEQEGSKCGCFHINREYRKGSGKVLQVNVALPVSKTLDERGFVVIKDFRSFRFGNLFIHRTAWDKLEIENVEQQEKLRACVKDVVEYVIQNGGFTVVGWRRLVR
jgi:hypothetical protein